LSSAGVGKGGGSTPVREGRIVRPIQKCDLRRGKRCRSPPEYDPSYMITFISKSGIARFSIRRKKKRKDDLGMPSIMPRRKLLIDCIAGGGKGEPEVAVTLPSLQGRFHNRGEGEKGKTPVTMYRGEGFGPSFIKEGEGILFLRVIS